MTGEVRLLSIAAEIHVYGGIAYWRQPLRLGLAFSDGGFLRIREQRGDSIGFDNLPLEAADLGEGGRVEVHDVTDRLDPSLRGAGILALRAIEEVENRTLGLAVLRRDAPAFCIWTDDDEFYWGGEAALQSAMGKRGLKVRPGRAIRP